MNDTETDQLPLFPTKAPEVFSDPTATEAHFEPVLFQRSPGRSGSAVAPRR